MTPFGTWTETGPIVLGGEDAEPAALDHGRATHADVGVGGGDDDVAASEQRGVAGEAASRDDADEGHLAAQRAEEREGLGVEPGHDGHVGVAGAAAAALGEEDDREAQPLDELEEAVLLAVVHLALGAGQDGVVVREHGAAGPFLAEEVAVDPADAGDEAVGRRVGDEVLGAAARPLGRDDEAAVLLEAARVAQVLDVLPGRPPPAGVPALGGRRAAGVEGGQRRRLRARPARDGPRRPARGPFVGCGRAPARGRRRTGLVLGRSGAARPRSGRRRPAATATEPHRPRRGGLHDVLHLHGLEHDEDGAGAAPGRRAPRRHGARCRRRAP